MKNGELTDKQKRFAELYVATLNASEAARKAGYSAKSDYSIGYEVRRKPAVRNYIRELIELRRLRTQISSDLIVQQLAEIARGEKGVKGSDRIKAIDRLAQHIGFFEEKRIAEYPRTFVAEDKLKALARAVPEKARRLMIAMEEWERQKVMTHFGEKGQEAINKRIDEAVEQGKLDNPPSKADADGELHRIEHEAFVQVLIESARETLTDLRFRQVLKDAGFDPKLHQQESSSVPADKETP